MKFFLVRLSYFILILVALNGILYKVGEKVYMRGYTRYSTKTSNYLFADSHGLPLKSYPENFEVFNFSAGSESYYDIRRKMSFLVNQTNIDTFYISVDDHCLSPYRDRMNNLDRSLFYLTFDEAQSIYDYAVNKYIVYNIPLLQPKTGAAIKSFIFSWGKKTLFGVQKLNNDKWVNLSQEKRISASESRFRTQFPVEEPSVGLANELRMIISLCKENSIVLIGVKFPITKEYSDIIGKRNYGADAILEKNGYEIRDFKKAFFGRNELFKNQDHLNKKGGMVFTSMLFNQGTKIMP